MEPGELGEPMQEKLLVLFGAADKRGGGSWMGIGRRSRLGTCVLVRAPAVPVPKVLPEAGEYAPLWSGLFRPLRSPVHEGALVCSGVFFWS